MGGFIAWGKGTPLMLLVVSMILTDAAAPAGTENPRACAMVTDTDHVYLAERWIGAVVAEVALYPDSVKYTLRTLAEPGWDSAGGGMLERRNFGTDTDTNSRLPNAGRWPDPSSERLASFLVCRRTTYKLT